MAYIEVEVNLEDFDLDEILKEIDSRMNSYRDRKENREKIKQFFIDSDIMEEKKKISLSLVDKMKIDFVMKNLDRITLNDLEKLNS